MNQKVLDIVKRVSKIANDRYDNDLSERCAIVSAFLVKKLNENNIKAYLMVGEYDEMGHAWVEYRGQIIDLTVRQFDEDKPKIYIVKSWHPKYDATWKKVTVEDYKTVFREWPEHQRPLVNRVNALERLYNDSL